MTVVSIKSGTAVETAATKTVQGVKLTPKEYEAIKYAFQNGVTKLWLYSPTTNKRVISSLQAKGLMVLGPRNERTLTDKAQAIFKEINNIPDRLPGMKYSTTAYLHPRDFENESPLHAQFIKLGLKKGDIRKRIVSPADGVEYYYYYSGKPEDKTKVEKFLKAEKFTKGKWSPYSWSSGGFDFNDVYKGIVHLGIKNDVLTITHSLSG